MNSQFISQIETVKIDLTGRFKYILIKITSDKEEKYILRGFSWAEYHGIKIFIYFSLNSMI
jgi:hypothetical protein